MSSSLLLREPATLTSPLTTSNEVVVGTDVETHVDPTTTDAGDQTTPTSATRLARVIETHVYPTATDADDQTTPTSAMRLAGEKCRACAHQARVAHSSRVIATVEAPRPRLRVGSMEEVPRTRQETSTAKPQPRPISARSRHHSRTRNHTTLDHV